MAEPAGPAAPAADRYPNQSWTTYLRSRPAAASFALLSFGAAAIHFAVSPDHFAEWAPYGVAFACLGWFQVLWAAAYLARPSRAWGRLAAVVNAGVVLVWLWSRLVGLPFGPEPGSREAVGLADTISSVFEALLVVGLVGQERRLGSALRGQPARWGGVAVAVTITVVLVTIAALVALAPAPMAMG
ncbi:MAG TPA: hypothetical protein VF763_01960 [Candidatus Limnocylindrales bacterium]